MSKLLFSAGKTFFGTIKEGADWDATAVITVGDEDVKEWLDDAILDNLAMKHDRSFFGKTGPEVVVEISIKVYANE